MNNHQLPDPSSVERFHALMEGLAFRKCSSSAVLVAALELHEDEMPRSDLLHQTRAFFSERAVFIPEGIESLPATWLSSLPTILWGTRRPEWEILPYFIRAVAVDDGVLRIGYAQELVRLGDRITLWDQLRVVVNLSIKPNLWTPLSKTDECEIWHRRLDLRHELFATW